MNFEDICADLINGVIVVEGASAEITRQDYYDRYLDWINTGQFVPIVYLNTVNSQISVSNTQEMNFVFTDFLTANDWICINAVV